MFSFLFLLLRHFVGKAQINIASLWWIDREKVTSALVENSTQEEIFDTLKKYKRVAVIGMSKNPEKDAYTIPEYLMKNGYEIIPVNPTADEILGKKSYKRLSEVPGEIDIVDVFRPSEDVPNYVSDVIKKRPKVFWEQLGIHNPEAEEDISREGIKIVSDRCMMQELRKLGMKLA